MAWRQCELWCCDTVCDSVRSVARSQGDFGPKQQEPCRLGWPLASLTLPAKPTPPSGVSPAVLAPYSTSILSQGLVLAGGAAMAP